TSLLASFLAFLSFVSQAARQSVALMFSHGLRRRGYIKVQEDSAHYWHKSWSCRVRDDRSIHSLFSLTLRIPEVSLNVSNH
ncbi:hypothetical protein, partial [Phormidesmis sp. 146-33]